MKKFKFRLERVLQYRKIVKDEKLRELILKNHDLHQKNEKLEELQMAALLNKIEEGVQMAAERVYLAGLYGQRLKNEIINQKVVVMEAEQVADEAMAEYVEAAKDEESLVTLKRKKKAEYIDYVNKEEGKFLDELTVQKGNTLNRKQG